MRVMRILSLCCFVSLVVSLGACTKKSDAPTSVTPVPAPKVAKGKQVYAQHCLACHNANPKLDGSVGPANYGSSLELIESKVLRGEYPSGYKPKRTSHVMPKFPFLANDVAALHEFLNTGE